MTGDDDLRGRIAELERLVAELADDLRHARVGTLDVRGLRIRRFERRVDAQGRRLKLLPREYDLLVCLALRAGATVDHATMTWEVLGNDAGAGTNVLAVHLSRLRAKLTTVGVTVVTERSRGYRLDPRQPS